MPRLPAGMIGPRLAATVVYVLSVGLLTSAIYGIALQVGVPPIMAFLCLGPFQWVFADSVPDEKGHP